MGHSVAVDHHSARADNNHTVHGAVFCGDPVDEDDPYGSLTNGYYNDDYDM